jgi:broad specificity phosphatase PhoE
LGLPRRTAPGLHEYDRTGVPYFDDPADFGAVIEAFFARPGKRVFGAESAEEVQGRFSTAVQRALEPHPEEDAVIVAHSTANTLFVAAHNPVAPFELWRAWPLGTFAALPRPDFGLLERPAPLA